MRQTKTVLLRIGVTLHIGNANLMRSGSIPENATAICGIRGPDLERKPQGNSALGSLVESKVD